MATKQLLLNGAGCSGRGVRVKVLDASTRLEVLKTAASEVGPDGTGVDLRLQESLSGVASIVVAVTEKAGFKKRDELAAAVWKPVVRKDLEDRLDVFFNAPDQDALFQIFQKLHSVTPKEVDNILGEAQDVSED